jgi:hypothetical protein
MQHRGEPLSCGNAWLADGTLASSAHPDGDGMALSTLPGGSRDRNESIIGADARRRSGARGHGS